MADPKHVRSPAIGLALAALAACGGVASGRGPSAPTVRPLGRGGVGAGVGGGVGAGAGDGAVVTSNILRPDYAGSQVCAPCHAEIFAAWLRSPMHEMTRLPEQARVRAPFDGEVFRFKDDSARLEQSHGHRFVRISSAERGAHVYRVTKVIGGRYREDYAGVEVPDVEDSAPPRAPKAELLLPISFVFDSASFRLKGYSVMVGERPGLRAGGVWNQTCVFCHNTNPYFDGTWGELFGAGAPGYQGEVVDRLLPPERRFTLDVTDGAAMAAALRSEVAFLGGPASDASSESDPAGEDGRRKLLGEGIRAMRDRLTPQHFVEIGIGCESCHGGSREHVRSDRVLPDFQPRSAFVKVRPPAGWGPPTRAEWINRTCARCHQVLFSRYPFTWEGGLRRGAGTPGGSSITSGEARDFLLGGCARRMSCTTCHDPHAEDRPDKLARLATVAGNGVCSGCHAQYRDAEALRRHAHHDPAGAGGACIACHMPRKNMGLGYALTRYHRIGSPTDPARVERDRPLECALCHADRSVGSLIADMERLWGKRYDRAALARLYGNLDANALVATVDRGKAHEQAPAMAVLGETRTRAALPSIARQLTHPIPLVRYYARRAVDAIRGGPPCAIDLDRSTPEIEAAARRCVPGAWTTLPAPPAARGQSRLDPPDED
jgi:predicted CXXCH cytochrome family protein